MKALKITAYSLLGVILLCVIAVVGITTFVNPNQFKPLISKQVQEATGRTLTMQGDLKWSFFPWLGIQVNKVQLSNAHGFGNKPFAKINQAELRIKLLPLIAGNVEAQKVVLSGLTLNLEKNKTGATNWQDLTQQAATEKPVSEQEETPNKTPHQAMKLSISAIDINDANINWDNQQSNQHFSIKNLSLQSNNIALRKPFPFNLSMKVNSDKFANNELDLSTNGLININLKNDTLAATKLNFQANNLKSEANIYGKNITSKPSFNGNISIPLFNLDKLLASIGKPLPKMQYANALEGVSANFNFAATDNSFDMTDLDATLDYSNIKGDVSITNFSKPAILYDLTINQLNLDNYLPSDNGSDKASKTSSGNTKSSAKKQVIEIPSSMLRDLKLSGHLAIGKLQAFKAKSSNLKIITTANHGLIKINPITANLYGGKYKGDLTLDVRGTKPKYIDNETLTNVQAGPLLTDMLGKQKLSLTGLANIHSQLNMQGNTTEQLRQSMNGKVSFSFDNGVIQGINIQKQLLLIEEFLNQYGDKINLLKGLNTSSTLDDLQSKQAAQTKNETKFGNLSGTFNINNGIAKNNDFKLISPLFTGSGQGKINLINEKIDYELNITQPQNGGNALINKIINKTGDSIPVRIEGNLSSPKVYPDLSRIVGQLLEKRAKEFSKKAGEKVKEFGKGLQEKLKGIFQ